MLPIFRLFKRKAYFAGPGILPGDWGRVSARNIRAERMTSSVPLPFMDDQGAQSVYDARTMGVSRSRTRRTDRYRPAVGSQDTGRIPPFSRDGISGVTACVVLVALAFTLGTACLVNRSHVIETSKRVQTMERRIEEINLANEELETELAARAASVNVGYEAAQMGMISSKGVNVVYLSAPEAANMTLTGGGSSLTGEHLATILGD